MLHHFAFDGEVPLLRIGVAHVAINGSSAGIRRQSAAARERIGECESGRGGAGSERFVQHERRVSVDEAVGADKPRNGAVEDAVATANDRLVVVERAIGESEPRREVVVVAFHQAATPTDVFGLDPRVGLQHARNGQPGNLTAFGSQYHLAGREIDAGHGAVVFLQDGLQHVPHADVQGELAGHFPVVLDVSGVAGVVGNSRDQHCGAHIVGREAQQEIGVGVTGVASGEVEGAELSGTGARIVAGARIGHVEAGLNRVTAVDPGEVVDEFLQHAVAALGAARVADGLVAGDVKRRQAADRHRLVESGEQRGRIEAGVLADADAFVVKIARAKFVQRVRAERVRVSQTDVGIDVTAVGEVAVRGRCAVGHEVRRAGIVTAGNRQRVLRIEVMIHLQAVAVDAENVAHGGGVVVAGTGRTSARRVRQWHEALENRLNPRIQAACGNLVIRERRSTRERVLDGREARKVAVAHGLCSQSQVGGDGSALPKTFIAAEEERFVLDDGSAQVTAEFVAVELRLGLRGNEEVLGRCHAVAVELKQCAMELVGPRLGDHRNRSGALILGLGVVAFDAQLLNGVHRGEVAELRLVGVGSATVAGIVVGDAVHCEEVASEVQTSGELRVRRTVGRVTGSDLNEAVNHAPVDWQRGYRLVIHYIGHGRRFGVDGRRGGGDVNLLFHGARLKADVRTYRGRHQQRDSRDGCRLEPFKLYLDFVGARN